jgi:hypothetical protein
MPVTQQDLELISRTSGNAVKTGADIMSNNQDRKLKEFLQGQAEQHEMAKQGEHARLLREAQSAQDAGKYKHDSDENALDRALKRELATKQLEALLGKKGAETSKQRGFIEAAEQSLNTVDSLTKENPKAAFIERIMPDALTHLIGGKLKEISTAKGFAKESMQSAITGAAAAGEQVPTFRGFSGPGLTEIVNGENSAAGDPVRAGLQTMKKNLPGGGASPTQAPGRQRSPGGNMSPEERYKFLKAKHGR